MPGADPLCLVLAIFGLAGPQTLTNVLAQVADEDELRPARAARALLGVNALLTKPAQPSPWP